MAAADVARPAGASTTSTTPATSATKNDHWWITPRKRGFVGNGGGEARAGRGVHQRMCIPEMAREITSRWISEVPSKMV